MNRLVIVGNGFDLAHGLPTGYCDFIDWYWRGVFADFKIDIRGGNFEDEILKINFSFRNREFYSEQPLLREELKEIKSYTTLLNFVLEHNGNNDSCEIKFFNSFFEIINKKRSIQNWVDIENEYYKLLKDCLKEENSNSQVKKLNKEFEEVKNLLYDYLNENIEGNLDFNVPNDRVNAILDLFMIRPKFLNIINPRFHAYMREFSKKEFNQLIDFDNQIIEFENSELLIDYLKAGKINQTNVFLNFNYTNTVDSYLKLISERDFFSTSYQIQIHGKLNDENNLINFGFGDEMDDDYKWIEKRDDNEYLKNIKSFQYLQNSNYKDLLDFIDSTKFQVYIMGHSCGLSDRILLNKIFEHNNCCSIKVFYHQFDKPKPDGRTDDYTERVQNISRHFNKKEMMREKIVDKSLCQPLPQIKLPLKENGSQS